MSLLRDLQTLTDAVCDGADQGCHAEAEMVIVWRGRDIRITVGLDQPIDVGEGGETLSLNWKAGE